MRALVLLNLLNESGKRDTRRGLPSILSLFRNELNEFNNACTNVRFYLSNDFEIFFCKRVFGMKTCRVCPKYATLKGHYFMSRYL